MKAVLLLNTGSPKSCERKEVKLFIKEMLSDPKVMTVPDWFRPILVNGLIIPFRQFASTRHYSLIWDHKRKSSPLILHAHELANRLNTQMEIPVEVAMRYREPSVKYALDKLNAIEGLKEVMVLPLFPHYAESSYKTAINEVFDCMVKYQYPFLIRIAEPYFDHPAYINALAESLKPLLETKFDKIIFNYHSLPLSHVEDAWQKGKQYDYVFQTKETMRLVTKKLNIDCKQARMTYSSAIGKDWLKPDLNETIANLAKEGARKIIVICPGFAADNLETLYDINIKAKDIFLKNGGTELVAVPCLNSSDGWVDAIRKILL